MISFFLLNKNNLKFKKKHLPMIALFPPSSNRCFPNKVIMNCNHIRNVGYSDIIDSFLIRSWIYWLHGKKCAMISLNALTAADEWARCSRCGICYDAPGISEMIGLAYGDNCVALPSGECRYKLIFLINGVGISKMYIHVSIRVLCSCVDVLHLPKNLNLLQRSFG